MTVTLASDMFSPPVDNILMISLFRYALEGRHRIEVDLQEPLVLAWLEMQSAGVQEEIRVAVDWSVEAEALEPSAIRVVVGNYQQNDWTKQPLQIKLDDARVFLDAPFSLVLEDATSDRDFLLKMLTPEERAFIVAQLNRGFLRVDHGGGLPNMGKQVAQRNLVPSSRYKTWVLFDSDALKPGAPSAGSELLRLICGDIPHHQLQRRCVESYLPPQALHAWAATGKQRELRQARFRLVGAFLRMRAEQRHHFNMKNGFAQDAKRTDASPRLPVR